jgi:D-aspartate ligase
MAAGKVLVVGAEENPSLPIIESLSRRGLEVHAASHKRICVGFFSRYTRRRFVYPSPFGDEEGFLEALLGYVQREKFDAMLVAGDRPTDLLARHREAFSPYTRLPLVGMERYLDCRDKTRTMKAAERLGIPIPKTFYPDAVPIDELAEGLEYPVVLKPNTSDGARGISFPKSREELLKSYAATVARFGPCHVQEYIPQTGMQYKAELLLDAAHEVKAWCVYSKIRYYPPTGGSSTLNSTVDRRDILDLAARMLQGIEWYGIGDCDFIEDPRDGVPKLMEINPRFTRSIKICSLAGVDFPYLLYRLALGESFAPSLEYRTGVYLRYLPADLVWFLKSRDRFRTRPSFFWFAGENLSDEVLSWRDPGPGIAYFMAKAASLLRPAERRYTLKPEGRTVSSKP